VYAFLFCFVRLYKGARLIHADLSEYNILIAPVFQVENPISSVEDTVNELQAVFIDFGQSVDVRHPDATALLMRDLERVRSFFVKQGVQTLSVEEAHELVTEDLVDDDETCEESVSSLPGGTDVISA
jgi:serine/threonine-protein kinase RIO1